jgi:hypothetical protein
VAKTPTDFARILATLRRHRVRFVVVGGVAAVIEGAPVATFDLDIVPDRRPQNVARLTAALTELDAHYRAKRDMPRAPTPAALEGDGYQLLMTRFGPLDVLGVIGVALDFNRLTPHSKRRKLAGTYVTVVDLETQLAVKEEVGQEKDRLVLPLLRATLAMQRSS